MLLHFNMQNFLDAFNNEEWTEIMAMNQAPDLQAERILRKYNHNGISIISNLIGIFTETGEAEEAQYWREVYAFAIALNTLH